MRRSATILLAAAALWACSEALPPPAPKSRPKPTVPAVAMTSCGEVSSTEGYVYTPIGKRDPFRNLLLQKEGKIALPQSGKSTPLQKWEIDQLVLRMTVTATSSPMAVIEDPEGRGWTVRLNDFVGKHFGKVKAIRRDEIEVQELIQDRSTGQVFPVKVPMRLKQDEAQAKELEELRQGMDGPHD